MASGAGERRLRLTVGSTRALLAFPPLNARATWWRPRARHLILYAAYALVVCAVLTAVVVPRLAAAILPLGADQGLYVTVGEVLNRGGVVGRDTWDTKPPGVYYLYAAILHFAPDYSVVCDLPVPFSNVGPHQLPCAQINLSTFEVAYALALCTSIWWVARRLFGEAAVGVIAALLCAIFSSMLQLGGGGIADVYVLLPSTLAYGAAGEYGRTSRRGWLVAAGASGALAGLFKQTGFLLLAGIVAWIVLSEFRCARTRRHIWPTLVRSMCALTLGAAAVLAPTAAYLARSGALGDVLDQAFLFNLYYVGRSANTNGFFAALLSQTWAVFSGSQSGLWIPGLMGVVLLARNWRNWRISLLLAWFLSSLLTIAAGGSQLHTNYYLALVPPLAICAAYAVTTIWTHTSVLARTAIVAAGVLLLAYSNQLQDHQYGNAWYSRILSNTHSTEEFVAGAIGTGSGSLFIWGNGPQVYALSGRLPASRYLHTLAISYDYAVHDELDRNRAELMDTLQQAPPQVIAIDTPWLRRARTLDFPELRAFIERNYSLANTPANPIFDGWEIYRRRAA